MNVLIVEADAGLAQIWCRHLEREGCVADYAHDHTTAISKLRFGGFDALVLDLGLPDSAVFAISDFATYRNPDIAIITVNANSFFSDGSIFQVIPNLRSHMQAPVSPGDLAAVVGHYGRPSGAHN